MPSDTVTASPAPLPEPMPAPPVLMMDAAMQAALNAALAQGQAQMAAYMASFATAQGAAAGSPDTVKAAGEMLIDPIGPLIVPPPGATLKGAVGLLFDTVPAMMPLDFPMLLPDSLGGGLNTTFGGTHTATILDTPATSTAIDLGDGTSLRFGDMAEINDAGH
ncbi:MAG: hypothetical protein NT133_15895 [Alphaproteobacteria bacterium]|nr:hypothetical protein [Alphaproteobacteria bacterium]